MKRMSEIESQLNQIQMFEKEIHDSLDNQTSANQPDQTAVPVDPSVGYVAYLTHLQSLVHGLKRTIETMDDACDESQLRLKEAIDKLEKADWNRLDNVPCPYTDLDTVIQEIEVRVENIDMMLFELSNLANKSCSSLEESTYESGDPVKLDALKELMKHQCPQPMVSKESTCCLTEFREKSWQLNQQNRKFLEQRRQYIAKCMKKIELVKRKYC